uniref:DNA-directed RNA polymerase subunit beta' n=1 Tax=Trithuria filamentosa TaxID=658028 RepID=V9PVW5_9MAGN|nr:RNA polymerase beta [Trithuria filamentosa]
MIDQYKHQQLRIGLVSPQQIRAWATKILPNGEGEIVGEVKKASTFDYESDEPVKDGLFCERIFGPIKSGFCACGNYQDIEGEKEQPRFCKVCGVESVDSRIRRYQMGYIKLARPMTHIWYLKRRPSYIANLSDQPLKDLEGLVYRGYFFARPRDNQKHPFLRLRGLFRSEMESCTSSMTPFFSTEGFDTLRNRQLSSGAAAIREKLADPDLGMIIDRSLSEWNDLVEEEKWAEEEKFVEEGSTGSEDWRAIQIRRRKAFLVRRIQLAKHFIQANVEPERMVLCLLPVLPPELRPLFRLEDEDTVVGSDINELYTRVISRNNRLTKLLRKLTPVELIRAQEKVVQEAVDTLLDNGIRGEPLKDHNNQVYKSFSDVISGKEGRFRHTLLGRRVDYSGRSVIVVGPSLSLHECGLPREIAMVLFQPFVIRVLFKQHLASSIKIAKSIIWQNRPIVWEILQQVMQGHPVLLNRAPTLHRLGILAFQPILVEGRAIWLHPLVCKGFNADFDGDQMGVHIPLSLEAQAEARLLMFSHTNLLSPAVGDPICVPTQDMLIGLYLLTIGNRVGIYANRYNPCDHKHYQNERVENTKSKFRKAKEPHFYSSYDALGAYRQKRIDLDSPLWLRWQLEQPVIASRNGEVPIEVQYESRGISHEIYGHYRVVRSSKKKNSLSIYIRTTVGHISFYREIEEALQGLEGFCGSHC